MVEYVEPEAVRPDPKPPVVTQSWVRLCREELESHPGVDNAICLQIAERDNRSLLRSKLKLITGGKT
jgi:hypothetical protein